MRTHHLLPSLLAISAGLSAADIGADLLVKSYDLDDIGGTLIGPSTPQGATSGSVDAYGLRLRGSLPMQDVGILKSPSLRFAIAYLTGKEESDEASGGSLGYIPVDGSGTSNGSGGVSTLTFSSEITEIVVDAQLAALAWTSDKQSLTGLAGLTFNQLEQERRQSGLDGSGASVEDQLHLDDDLTSTSYGISLGAEYAYAIGGGFSVEAGARVDALFADHELETDQMLVGTPFSVQDDDSGFAAAYRGRLAVTWRGTALAVQLFGEVESVETATTEHATLDSDVFPTELDTTQVTNFTLGLGASYTL